MSRPRVSRTVARRPGASSAARNASVARLKRMLHEWDGVEERSRAEGEGQVEWQRSGPGLPYQA